MRMYLKRCAALALIFASIGSAHAAPQQYPDENTVIVDGVAWKLDTMGFTQVALNQFAPAGDVAKNISDVVSYFKLLKWDYNLATLAKSLTNPDLNQVVFTNKLPDDCVFTPSENLPIGAVTINVGCTKGVVTYLIPQYLQKLDPMTQTLLWIHERLHAYAPAQSLEVKTDIVKALNILLTKYRPALQQPPDHFKFTDDELTLLNKLPFRFQQLVATATNPGTQLNQSVTFSFRPEGGLVTGSLTIVGDLFVGLGSEIDVFSPQTLQAQGLRISGNSVLQLNAIMNLKNVKIVNSNISGGGTIDGGTITQSSVSSDAAFSGASVQISNSSVVLGQNAGTGAVSDLTIDNCDSCYFRSVSGARIRLKNINKDGGRHTNEDSLSIAGNNVNLSDSSFFGEVVLAGSKITVAHSSLSDASYAGNYVDIEQSSSIRTQLTNLSGFTQIQTTIQCVVLDILNAYDNTLPVVLDHAELHSKDYDYDYDYKFHLYPGLTFRHGVIQILPIQDPKRPKVLPVSEVTLGMPGISVTIDGGGRSIIAKIPAYQSQQDFDKNGAK